MIIQWGFYILLLQRFYFLLRSLDFPWRISIRRFDLFLAQFVRSTAFGASTGVIRKIIIDMKHWKFLLAIVVIFAACNGPSSGEKKKQVAADTTLRISVDESFQPVIEEEVKVFESSYPDTKVIVEYKPEAECLRDLQKDSTKIIIILEETSCMY